MLFRTVVALAALTALTACAGVGIVDSNDPNVKVAQAEQLTRVGRAAQARRQLDEAIPLFEAKNDKAGLAEVYRQYGFLARLGGAQEGVIAIRQPVAAYSSANLALSDQYLHKSVALFAEADRLDMASNVYMQLSNNAYFRKETKEACAYLDHSSAVHRQWQAKHPGAAIELPQGMKTFDDLIAYMKKETGCA